MRIALMFALLAVALWSWAWHEGLEEKAGKEICVLACMADDEDREPLSEEECERMCE